MRAAADEGYTTATAVADALVRRGVPFRAAHHVVGSLVAAGRGGRHRRSTPPDEADRRGPRRQRRPWPRRSPGSRGSATAARGGAIEGALAVVRRHRRDGAARVAAALAGPQASACARASAGPPRLRASTIDAPCQTSDAIHDRAPKALLHDHLDGGLRPATIIDLAGESGYAGLPTDGRRRARAWFRRGADRKSLELYLETFAHTVGRHAGARRDRRGSPRNAPRTWRPTASSTPRSASRPSCAPSAA